jgi:putative ABC transport system permease protein
MSEDQPMNGLLQDLRYAMRQLRKSPGFTAIAVLTPALGIGANSAVFSAIDAILLKPLPFPHGDELMLVRQYVPKEKSPSPFVAPVRLEDWNRMNSTFQALTGYDTEDVSETSGELPQKITRAGVSPRFLPVWGIAPSLGRDFAPEEERFGGPDAALISDRLWRNQFHSDPNAVGKKLWFGKYSSTIVGVMPASFLFPDKDVDVWVPVAPDAPYATRRDATWYTVIGRLKPFADVMGTLVYDKPKFAAVGFSACALLGFVLAVIGLYSVMTYIVALKTHDVGIRLALGAPHATIVRMMLTRGLRLTATGVLIGVPISLGLARLLSSQFRGISASDPVTLVLVIPE